MKSKHVWLCLALLLAAVGLQAQKGETPAQAVFNNDSTNRIHGDGNGAYINEVDCVRARFANGTGRAFVRTTVHDCTAGTPRTLEFDFSDPVLPGPTDCSEPAALGPPAALNICGSNTVPDARIIADQMFKDVALTEGTSVTAYLNLALNTNSAFSLEFEQNVPVGLGSRILMAPLTAVARLYKHVPVGQGKIKKQLVHRFYMPFEMKLTALP